ncbi:unnamed protein product [Dracunculus medinensis]|uniref:SH3 domain-containing protein n=1 Tax=Dracunculus medinensis TaxID=318479 RepID=A0A0N4UMQ2_DRAME|nr:unnamed protein product [Dracunculus medinensis]
MLANRDNYLTSINGDENLSANICKGDKVLVINCLEELLWMLQAKRSLPAPFRVNGGLLVRDPSSSNHYA